MRRVSNSRSLSLLLASSRWALVALSVVVLFALTPPPTVSASSITVTTTDDELNADGDCSLREVIVAANTDSVVDACAAGSGADTIILQAGATYALNVGGVKEDAGHTGDLDVTDDLTIEGNGATIDGGYRLIDIQFNPIVEAGFGDRIFDIRSGVSVEIDDLTITGGRRSGKENDIEFVVGGGILNRGHLILSGVTVTGNAADATPATVDARGWRPVQRRFT